MSEKAKNQSYATTYLDLLLEKCFTKAGLTYRGNHAKELTACINNNIKPSNYQDAYLADDYIKKKIMSEGIKKAYQENISIVRKRKEIVDLLLNYVELDSWESFIQSNPEPKYHAALLFPPTYTKEAARVAEHINDVKQPEPKIKYSFFDYPTGTTVSQLEQVASMASRICHKGPVYILLPEHHLYKMHNISGIDGLQELIQNTSLKVAFIITDSTGKVAWPKVSLVNLFHLVAHQEEAYLQSISGFINQHYNESREKPKVQRSTPAITTLPVNYIDTLNILPEQFEVEIETGTLQLKANGELTFSGLHSKFTLYNAEEHKLHPDKLNPNNTWWCVHYQSKPKHAKQWHTAYFSLNELGPEGPYYDGVRLLNLLKEY